MRLIRDALGRPTIDTTDPDLMLTAEQAEALSPDGEWVVTAGAGAGKTHVLSLRYANLFLRIVSDLRSKPSIDQVVVTTFTERAASEMKARCRQRLQQASEALTALATTDDEIRMATRLHQLSARSSRAWITTIHGFCSRISRQYASAFSLPEEVGILDPAEVQWRQQQHLQRSFDRFISDNPKDLVPLLDILFSRQRVLEAMQIVINRWEVIHHRLDELRESDFDNDPLLTKPIVAAQHAETWLKKKGDPTLRAVRVLTKPGRHTAFVRRLPYPREVKGDLEIFSRYRLVLGSLLRTNGSTRRLDHSAVMNKQRHWSDLTKYRKVKLALSNLGERIEHWPALHEQAKQLPTPADVVLLEGLQVFSRLMLDTHDRWMSLLKQWNMLDFESLQSIVVNGICHNPQLASELRSRFRYFMVDEFQDTDQRQWDLFSTLGRQDPEIAEDRLFVVGDAKQAIYGFRGGDVAVFTGAAQRLKVSPHYLPHNFRSSKALIGFFNSVFEGILGHRESRSFEPFEACYDPVVPGRDDKKSSQITWIDAPVDEQPLQVAQFLRANEPKGVTARPHTAILLRNRTNLESWLGTLEKHGISVAVAGGVGFWRQPEIGELVDTLAALELSGPRAVVACLRAPWIGLSDRQVDDYLRSRGETPVYENNRVELGFVRLRRLHAILDSEGPEQAMAKIIQWASPGWASALAEANAWQLHQRVSEWQYEGVATSAIVRRLWVLIEQDANEATIRRVSQADVVLSTIHGSKGLQYHRVIVAETDRTVRFRAPIVEIRRNPFTHKIDLATMALDPSLTRQTRSKPARLHLLSSTRERQEYAEYKRLLYVAMTRAQDDLVLVGTVVENDSKFPSWAQLLGPYIGGYRWPGSSEKMTSAQLSAPEVPKHNPFHPIRAVEKITDHKLWAWLFCPYLPHVSGATPPNNSRRQWLWNTPTELNEADQRWASDLTPEQLRRLQHGVVPPLFHSLNLSLQFDRARFDQGYLELLLATDSPLHQDHQNRIVSDIGETQEAKVLFLNRATSLPFESVCEAPASTLFEKVSSGRYVSELKHRPCSTCVAKITCRHSTNPKNTYNPTVEPT